MAETAHLRQTAGLSLPSSRIVSRFHRHRGAAATETLLIAVPLFLTGLGTVEAARWWGVRQAVGLAVMEAAREGSTSGADSAAIGSAMARALLPLVARDASPVGLAEGEARQRDTAARLSVVGLSEWEIRVISPRRAHFEDFGRAAAGGRELPDTYQAERHRGELGHGTRRGAGAASGDTIFAANTLVLEATYLHAPLVPGVSALLRGLGQAAPAGLAGDGMRRAGFLPMTMRVSLPMQTPAREAAAGAVIRPAALASPSPVPVPVAGTGACAGLWCPPSGGTLPPSPPTGAPPPASATPTLPWEPPVSGGASPGTPPAPLPGAEDGCGVVLCCPGGATLPA
ncbi:pilus assembly protein [Achromobacter sp. GG226]|uniref:TadE/TadG family type IV pilus assembly protein n=1 Tax=Verticiella alkaliphila TaxID=2779529 RepID=UPI001C0C0471|nr:TadE family protein [Verticiella sp. GG226]MBU4610584.1 pilus assembly protein [Verticiella sp. GG226]